MSYKTDLEHYLSQARTYLEVGEYGVAMFHATLAVDRLKRVKNPTRREVITVKRVVGEAYIGLEKRLDAM